jgi:hypothetical protein
VRQAPDSGSISNRDLDWTLGANEITDSEPVVKTKLNNEKACRAQIGLVGRNPLASKQNGEV